MADKNSFPQIPSTVWWGLRAILNRTPAATVDERFLSIQLGVQEAAARQYVAELRKAGMLNDEGRATQLAHKWRIDDSYLEAVGELLKRNYPDSLLQVAPPEVADRARATAWFVREGLGSGTANNKAASYLLIGSQSPGEAPTRAATGSKGVQKGEGKAAISPKMRIPKEAVPEAPAPSVRSADVVRTTPDVMPLNVNVQIHIGADATSEQIENIFSAMRRYLYNDEVR